MSNKTPDEKIDEIVERYPLFWKSKSAFMSFLRGGVRQGLWNKHKIKLLKIKQNRLQIPNPNPKGKKPTVFGGKCEVCGGLFVEKDLQVDHVRDEGSSLKCFDDVSQFIEDMVLITEDDLRIVCKGCHSVISHAQKTGLSFEEARADKTAKQIVDKKLDKQWLKDNNVEAATTQVARRKQIKDLLLNQMLKARADCEY